MALSVLKLRKEHRFQEKITDFHAKAVVMWPLP